MSPRRRRNRLDFRSICLRAKMSLQKLTGLRSIRVVHDVVAVEHAAGLVAAEFHRNAFGDAGAHHVANRSAPEIVNDNTAESSLPARCFPSLSKIADRFTVVLKHIPAIRTPLLVRALDDLPQLPPSRKRPTI